MVAFSWKLFVLNYHSWISPTAGKLTAVFGGVTLPWVTGDTQTCQMSHRILMITPTIAVLYFGILSHLQCNMGNISLPEELKVQIESCLSWKLHIFLSCAHYSLADLSSLAWKCQGWSWGCPKEVGKELKEQWMSDIVWKVKSKWPRKKWKSINWNKCKLARKNKLSKDDFFGCECLCFHQLHCNESWMVSKNGSLSVIGP